MITAKGNIKEISGFVPKKVRKTMDNPNFEHRDKFVFQKTTAIEQIHVSDIFAHATAHGSRVGQRHFDRVQDRLLRLFDQRCGAAIEKQAADIFAGTLVKGGRGERIGQCGCIPVAK